MKDTDFPAPVALLHAPQYRAALLLRGLAADGFNGGVRAAREHALDDEPVGVSANGDADGSLRRPDHGTEFLDTRVTLPPLDGERDRVAALKFVLRVALQDRIQCALGVVRASFRHVDMVTVTTWPGVYAAGIMLSSRSANAMPRHGNPTFGLAVFLARPLACALHEAGARQDGTREMSRITDPNQKPQRSDLYLVVAAVLLVVWVLLVLIRT